jgi:SEC-C motif-containing protein
MTDSKTLCACGSGANYADCCEPFHLGKATAPTAEALMRSRYCAYVMRQIDYLVGTTLPAARTTDLWVNYQSTADSIQWIGLEVVATSQGGATDKTGKVEFKASYIQDGVRSIHHELSRFRRSGGAWYYVDGRVKDYVSRDSIAEG